MNKKLERLLDSVEHILSHYEEYSTITDEIMNNLEEDYDNYMMAKAEESIPLSLDQSIDKLTEELRLQMSSGPFEIISMEPELAEAFNKALQKQENDGI
jgi:hypothetical protein